MVSRRRFLAAGGGSVLLAGCPLTPTTPVPLDSPLRRGSFPVGRAILGVTPGTSAVPVPGAIAFNTITRTCGNIDLPAQVPAMVYYPAVEDSDDLQRRIDFWIALPRPLPTTVPPPLIPAPAAFHRSGHPLILYAHGRRANPRCPGDVPTGFEPSFADVTQDFRRADRLLSHIASHGCVVAAVDVGWLSITFENHEWGATSNPPRASMLLALHAHLEANSGMFGGLVNMRRLGLFGHSTGAHGCLHAIQRLNFARMLGLLAPAANPIPSWVIPPPGFLEPPLGTVVIGGELDTIQVQAGAPRAVFDAAVGPSTLAILGGANHFGYTELCTTDNQVCLEDDPPGRIARLVQAEVAASLFAAGMRLYLQLDTSMRPFLDGSRDLGAAQFLRPAGANVPPLELRSKNM